MVLEKESAAVLESTSWRTTTLHPPESAAVTNGTCTSPPVSAADMRYCHSMNGA
jgi:hypothetical protein